MDLNKKISDFTVSELTQLSRIIFKIINKKKDEEQNLKIQEVNKRLSESLSDYEFKELKKYISNLFSLHDGKSILKKIKIEHDILVYCATSSLDLNYFLSCDIRENNDQIDQILKETKEALDKELFAYLEQISKKLKCTTDEAYEIIKLLLEELEINQKVIEDVIT